MKTRWVRSVFIIAALTCAAAAAQAAPPKRVLLLHSFGREFAPYSVFAAEFRTELARNSPGSLDFYDVSLQTARFTEGDSERPFVDYVRTLFSGQPPDLIVP